MKWFSCVKAHLTKTKSRFIRRDDCLPRENGFMGTIHFIERLKGKPGKILDDVCLKFVIQSVFCFVSLTRVEKNWSIFSNFSRIFFPGTEYQG